MKLINLQTTKVTLELDISFNATVLDPEEILEHYEDAISRASETLADQSIDDLKTDATDAKNFDANIY